VRQGTRSPSRAAAPTPRSSEGLAQPTPEEAANGWTPHKLAEYRAQAAAAEHSALMNRLCPEKPPLQVETVGSFNPHHW
jgi:hypothetical protein